MSRYICLAAVLVTGGAGGAWAQPVSGPYVSLGGGANFLQDEKPTSPGVPGLPSLGKLGFNTGVVGSAALGYGFGNGFRVEAEGNWRQNDLSRYDGTAPDAATGKQRNVGGLANVIFDMDVGANWIYPYFGAGAGYAQTRWRGVAAEQAIDTYVPTGFAAEGSKSGFAYQGLFGVSLPVAYVPGLSVTAEYRFYAVTGAPTFPAYAYEGLAVASTRIGPHTDFNHSLMAGLRYELFPPPPPVTPAPVTASPATPPPAIVQDRTYLVFFDWDRADLTARAKQIVASAAQASTQVRTTQITVSGYTDLSGTATYNQALSVRRATTVQAELVRDGVPANEIEIHGYGESTPLVPTAPGVREPQNRRVEIVLK